MAPLGFSVRADESKSTESSQEQGTAVSQILILKIRTLFYIVGTTH